MHTLTNMNFPDVRRLRAKRVMQASAIGAGMSKKGSRVTQSVEMPKSRGKCNRSQKSNEGGKKHFLRLLLLHLLLGACSHAD